VPEGDTVHLAAKRLHRAFAGQPLTRTDFRVPRYATVDLSGRAVHEVVARGKHLLFRLEGGKTLHTHYRMEGSWHLYRRGQRWRGPRYQVRAVLENASWVAVGFRLPVIDILETDAEDDVVGHLGPDPLGPDWDPGLAAKNLATEPERAIGSALLDQRSIAGPGNVYKSEVLFLAGTNPWTPVGATDVPKIVDVVARAMQANRSTGSQITTGRAAPGEEHWVYGRYRKPCRRCRTPIDRADQEAPGGDRVTFWCPTCQPLSGPPAT
jgi:endonuclease-8